PFREDQTKHRVAQCRHRERGAPRYDAPAIGGGGISVRAAPCLKALPTRNRPPLPRVASAQKGVALWKCSPPHDPLGPASTMQTALSRWTRSQRSSAL